MPKLLVRENKKLVLNKVIKNDLFQISSLDLQKKIDDFNNDLIVNQAQLFGPNIIQYKESTITSDGRILLNLTIYQQAHNYKEFSNKYDIEEKFSSPKCIYLRYDGIFIDMDIIEKKIDVYCYENNLITKPNIFVIMIEQSEDRVIADYFKEVI